MYTFDPPPKGYFNGAPDIQPYGQGLFPDQAQSWRL